MRCGFCGWALRQVNGEDTIFVFRSDLVLVRFIRQAEGSFEAAVGSLDAVEFEFGVFFFHFAFAAD